MPAFSPLFYTFYISAGLTDIADGFVARKTNTVTAFGSKLDTLAAFLFVLCCLIKLLPILEIPRFLWIWTGIIFFIKAANVIFGYALHKKFAAVHSPMNKAVGLMLFFLPLSLRLIDSVYGCTAVCIAATLAAIQEGYYIKSGKAEYL